MSDISTIEKDPQPIPSSVPEVEKVPEEVVEREPMQKKTSIIKPKNEYLMYGAAGLLLYSAYYYYSQPTKTTTPVQIIPVYPVYQNPTAPAFPIVRQTPAPQQTVMLVPYQPPKSPWD